MVPAIATVLFLAAPPQDDLRTLTRAAFVNVRVVDVENSRILEGRTVQIEDGRIKSIHEAGKADLPPNTFSIDGAGKYLSPGLADMHVHHTGSGAFVTGSEPPLYGEQDLLLYLINGVTTVRNMSGMPLDIEIKRKLAAGEISGPHYYSSGPPLISVDRGLYIDTPQKARDVVAAQKRAGYDFIKMYCCFGGGLYAAIVQSAEENKIPLVGHVQLRLPLEDAFRLRSIEHLEMLPRYFNNELPDIKRQRHVVEQMLASHTFVCPTLLPFEGYKFLDVKTLSDHLARPEIAYIPTVTFDEEMNAIRKHESFLSDEKEAASTKRMFELGMQYAYFLHQQGVPLILGSDAGGIFPLVPGFSIHRELELLNLAGLSPMDALRTGTINVARFLGNSDTRGSIAENKESDVVLLDENPLVSISNTRTIRGVMIGKTWIDKAAIDRILLRLKKR
ncbi:MAG: amidohydrolase family protein [Vicinamibacteria bacterium]|nr:amidohydrolase family protein [Vicinamibacteria bacterium]